MNEEFFAGTGEVAALMRMRDWAKTPVGPANVWPQSLKTTVRILLTSRFSMWVGWGPELTFFYNDAYRKDTLGVKHPWAMGASAREVWAEIWSDIGPRIEKVLQTGEATWDEALLLFLERSGYTEETYHTFSYSPLSNDEGAISGMLCVVTEETQRVIGERRMALLRDIGSALVSVQTKEEVFAAIAQCIENDSRDLPFTLTYLFDAEGGSARLVSATGVPAGHPLAAPVIGQEAADTPWPLPMQSDDLAPTRVENLAALFTDAADLPHGPWEKPPHEAILVPIAQQGQERPAGFLIAAINPYRAFDENYAGFINLLTGQIAASLANARAYEEEKRRAEALAELDRAKTAFFGNVSHEFRTPLTLMLGPMEDALSEGEKTLRGENLATVHRNGLRLLKLVNTLLDFSRIEAGRVQASYEPTDLADFTAELVSVFRSAIEKAGMTLRVDCPPLSEPVFIDRDMWEKIVLNLLSNAFKFTLEGEIAVTLREKDGQAVLTVRDTGTGISDEQLPHIFERFHRVEGVRARTQEGTGIGLALVRELVYLHGGAVGVESVAGEGTTFAITLPLGKAHLPSERISAQATLSSTALRADTFVEEALRWLPQNGQESAPYASALPVSDSPRLEAANRACVILADDNADMRQYVQNLLRPQYEVVAVPDGEAALRAARETKADMVISDVMMPKLDGFGLLQALRKNPQTARIPVILLSARAGEEARIEGLSAGADDYLIKPFSARELLARVASHLELSRVRRQYEIELATMNARLQRAMTETHHRVKNNLQLMAALIDMQRAGGEEMFPVSALARLSGNVRALGVIHDLLTQEAKDGSDQETLSMRSVLTMLIEAVLLTTGGRPIKTDLDDARIFGRQATALALITNELISNALKHGKGEIEINLKINGDAATLEVCDDGPGFPEGFHPEKTANTGIQLIENVVQWDLRGETLYANHPEGGARIHVTFPLTAPA